MAADMVAIPVWCEHLGEEHEVLTPAGPSVSQFEGLIYKQHHSKLPEGVTPAQIKVFGPNGRRYSGHRVVPSDPGRRLAYRIVEERPREEYEAFMTENVSREFERTKQDISNVFETQSLVDDGKTPEGRESLNALMSVARSLPKEAEEEEETEEAEDEEEDDGDDGDEEELEEEKEEGEEVDELDEGEDGATRRILVRHSNSPEVHELRVSLDATVVDIEMQVFQEILHEPETIEAGQVILFIDGRNVEFPHPFTPPVGEAFGYHIAGEDSFQFVDDMEDMVVSDELKVLQNFMGVLASELPGVTGCTPDWRELVLTMQAFLKAAEKRISGEGETMAAARQKASKLGSRLIKTLDNILKIVSKKKEHLTSKKATEMLRGDLCDTYGTCSEEEAIDKELWRAFLGAVTHRGGSQAA